MVLRVSKSLGGEHPLVGGADNSLQKNIKYDKTECNAHALCPAWST